MTDDDRAAEAWFRARGLPRFAGGHRYRLLVRTVPAIVLLAAWELIGLPLDLIDARSEVDLDRLLADERLLFGYNALWVATFVVPAVLAWLAARWSRRRVLDGGGTPVAVAVAAVYVVGTSVLPAVIDGDDPTGYIVASGAIVVGLVVLTLSGVGSPVGSALRQTRTLGAVATRALPLLLLFSVFGVLTNEVWQMAAQAGLGRILLVTGLFLVAGALFLVSAGREELRALGAVDPVPRSLEGTPFAGAAPDTPTVPLRPVDRANVVLALAVTQLVQAVVVGIVMFVFFVLLGTTTVTPDLMKTWSGRELTAGSVLGVPVAAPQELLLVCLFIAAFSALYFLAATVTDAAYRSTFFDPFVRDIATSVAARDVHLHRRSASSTIRED